MDSMNCAIDSNINHDKSTEEITLLVPSLQQLTVVSMQNELNARQRKSYDYQHDLPIARRPSDRRSSNTSLFLEYVCTNFIQLIQILIIVFFSGFYRRN